MRECKYGKETPFGPGENLKFNDFTLRYEREESLSEGIRIRVFSVDDGSRVDTIEVHFGSKRPKPKGFQVRDQRFALELHLAEGSRNHIFDRLLVRYKKTPAEEILSLLKTLFFNDYI